MNARPFLIAYSIAMSAASMLIQPCPCCGPIVKYTRALGAALWVGVAVWAFLSARRRFEMCLVAFALSLVQVANHWNQFAMFMDFRQAHTWVVPLAGLGALVFATLAFAHRRKAAVL
jgi:hypothetical protein